MSALDDTICAVATPAGEGGVGIVRVSGSQAVPYRFQCRQTLVVKKPFQILDPYQLYLGKISLGLFPKFPTQVKQGNGDCIR